jgi:NRE family putative nickel resistance protein-like MFS transporter
MPRRSVQRTAEIFRVLKDPEIRALWLSDWISDAGSFVTFIALAVYVNKLTGSATAVGLALALRSVPWFTIGPFAGLVADRLDRRAVMVSTHLIRAVLVGCLPFTHAAWQAYVLSVSSAVFAPVFRPARSALLAQVAAGDKLVPTVAVTETTHQLLHSIGPAFGGLIVLVFGARNAFFVDAASFVIAAAVLQSVAPRGRPVATTQSAVQDLREGFRAVARMPAVRTYAALNAGLALGFGGIIALLVTYLRDTLGRPGGEYGIVLSVMGLGTVLTSVAIAATDNHHARTPWVLASVAGVGAFTLVWFEPSFLVLMPIAFAAGLADAGAGIPMTATLPETLPDALRGRAYGVVMALYELTSAVGSLGFAWLGEAGRLGPARGMAAAAATGAALGGIALLTGGAKAIRAHEHERLAAIKDSTRGSPGGGGVASATSGEAG